MEFSPQQQVTVCKAYNQFNEGDTFTVATTNKLPAYYSVTLKDSNGNVVGCIDQRNLIAKK